MVSSSSTKRAARLAEKGKRQRVRFQGGTLFPAVIAAVLLIGVLLVVYARQSQPAASAERPSIDDHWHIAYGFELCSADNFTLLNGNKEDASQPNFQAYVASGVHSHDDGIMHWHPFSTRAVGRRATLGVFLETYGVELSDDRLTFPADQGGDEYVSGETKCGDKTGTLRVVVWDHFNDTGDGTQYVSNFDDIRITNDQMAFTIAFVPDDVDLVKPPWATDLPALGAADAGQADAPGASTPEATSPGTGPGATTDATASDNSAAGTEPGATEPAGTATDETDSATATTNG